MSYGTKLTILPPMYAKGYEPFDEKPCTTEARRRMPLSMCGRDAREFYACQDKQDRLIEELLAEQGGDRKEMELPVLKTHIKRQKAKSGKVYFSEVPDSRGGSGIRVTRKEPKPIPEGRGGWKQELVYLKNKPTVAIDSKHGNAA